MLLWSYTSEVGFSRDGTSRDNPGQVFLSHRPSVPGQKKYPDVSSRIWTGPSYSGTNSSVPGHKIFKKNFSQFFHLFCPLVVPGFYEKGRERLSKSRPGLARGKISKPCPIPHSVPDFDWLSQPVLSHDKILSFSCCPFVPGQQRNFCPIVPKSCTVLLETLLWRDSFLLQTLTLVVYFLNLRIAKFGVIKYYSFRNILKVVF